MVARAWELANDRGLVLPATWRNNPERGPLQGEVPGL